MAQTADILTFPSRRVYPRAVGLPNATPADDALVDQVRRQTREVIAAHRQADRDELVAAVLLAMENAPLTPAFCYPSRPIDGPAFVVVTIGDTVFKMAPDDCRTAAQALIADQAFAGCVGVAGNLREAAAAAESRANNGGPLGTAAHGVTGRATTLFLALLMVAAMFLLIRQGL
jgi:hypothetical protein